MSSFDRTIAETLGVTRAPQVPPRPVPLYSYLVSFSRWESGSAEVIAPNEQVAHHCADKLSDDDICWSEDPGEGEFNELWKEDKTPTNADALAAWDAQYAAYYTPEGFLK